MVGPPHPPLVDFVRHIGDHVAMVIARPGPGPRRGELIAVDYEELKPRSTRPMR
jgi:hypothetical protein